MQARRHLRVWPRPENAVLSANQPATRCQMPINEAIAARLSRRQCRNRMARRLLCLFRNQAGRLRSRSGASFSRLPLVSSAARLPANGKDLNLRRGDRMSTNHPKALAVIGWTDAPLASIWPRSLFADPSKPSFAARARTRIRRLFASIDGRGTKTPAGTGGPGAPPEEPLSNTVWDDPALWMLMMH
jgi:hypothetical protein